MTALDKAMFVCGVILIIILGPFMILAVTAGIQALLGDWTAWNGLLDQGWHMIGFYVALLCCLTLIVGAMLG